jgi:diacylglycerol kinase family enzyme
MLLPHAELDDGKLDILVSTDTSKLNCLRMLPKVFKGAHLDSPYVRLLKGERIEVSSDRPFVIYADGDPIGELPATIRAVPKGVRVLLPA